MEGVSGVGDGAEEGWRDFLAFAFVGRRGDGYEIGGGRAWERRSRQAEVLFLWVLIWVSFRFWCGLGVGRRRQGSEELFDAFTRSACT